MPALRWLIFIAALILRLAAGGGVDLQAGDWPSPNDQHDADGELILTRIAEKFERTAYHLRHLTLQSSSGQTQTIPTTNEHPAYVPELGLWIRAADVEVGQSLNELPGSQSLVTATRQETHRQGGVKVYNFRLAEGHTYFVREAGSQAEPVWVHNYDVNSGDVPTLARAARNERTNGILSWLDKVTGEPRWVRLLSGAKNAVDAGLSDAQFLPGATEKNWHHVEYQALQVMELEGITDAKLAHNWWQGDRTCYYCADDGNPLRLQQSLRQGSTLQLPDRVVEGIR